MKRTVLLVLIILVFTRCGAKKRAAQKNKIDVTVDISTNETSVPTTEIIVPTYKTTEQYIAFFKSEAIHEMKLYGIPASITLAQGILESGSGKGRLAREANNHFGGYAKVTPELILFINQFKNKFKIALDPIYTCLLYTSPSPRDVGISRMPSSA